MAGRPVQPLPLTASQRDDLERWATHGSRNTSIRARIILGLADGFSHREVAERIGCSSRSVSRWSIRFRRQGLDGLQETSSRRTLSGEPLTEDTGKAGSKATMRTVAQVAEVSPMTVSRVLSNKPNVHPDLRARVIQAAAQTEYRPDPELRKLMAHLRKQKTFRQQGTICSLEARSWLPGSSSYFSSTVEGARHRARALGFSWETYPVEELIERPHHTLDILYHRGVEGILISPASPSTRHRELTYDADWSRFSIIAATYSIFAPAFRRVVPDHFKNTTKICRTLADRGCERIGLAISQHLDQRTYYHHSGSYSAFHNATSRAPLPLCYCNTANDFERLKDWYQREQPDGLIFSSGWTARNFSRRLQPFLTEPIAIASISLPEEYSSGVDELPEQIGAIAIDTLSGMIIHHEKGLPENPIVTMLEGQWREHPQATIEPL